MNTTRVTQIHKRNTVFYVQYGMVSISTNYKGMIGYFLRTIKYKQIKINYNHPRAPGVAAADCVTVSPGTFLCKTPLLSSTNEECST